MECLYKLFEIVYKGDLPFLPHLFLQPFLSAWTPGYFCSNLGCNPVLCYSMAQIVPGLSIGHPFRLTLESFWHCLSLSLLSIFWAMPSFLKLKDYPTLFCVLCPTAIHVFKKLWAFYWRIIPCISCFSSVLCTENHGTKCIDLGSRLTVKVYYHQVVLQGTSGHESRFDTVGEVTIGEVLGLSDLMQRSTNPFSSFSTGIGMPKSNISTWHCHCDH